MRALRIIVLVLGLLTLPAGPGSHGQDLRFLQFGRYLESLRQQAGIPGLSAAIVQNRRIVWEGGFGFQDIDGRIFASPDTAYLVADLTATFAAVLLMQCVEQGTVHLGDPIRQWAPSAAVEPGTRVYDVLAHASIGDGFRYDPSRYDSLTPVIDRCSDEPYRTRLAHDILDRLSMVNSVPGRDLGDPTTPARQLFEPEVLNRYATVLSGLAVPYRTDRKGRPTRSEYPPGHVTASAGIVSTVRDLARYDAALDDRILLREDSLTLSWTNAVSPTGIPLPTGLGWFVQIHKSERLLWHFGLSPGAFSSLILKVPGRELTFIALANSDDLSASFSLEKGDVTWSVFAKLFLGLFA
jgi:CubicO group peptidase (beta-lactamase class C family)